VISELRQPGAPPKPKRITPALRQAILQHVRPGDVFITRHDDALSNLFLPGFWPHAALYLGPGNEPATSASTDDPGSHHLFIEAKKDGVLKRSAAETLQVDALIVLRPPLNPAEIRTALARAHSHVGKLYDFTFDFRTSHRLACTEVVYRAYHHCGPLEFHLREVGGRLCLSAEELITQALSQNFDTVLTCGLSTGEIATGQHAYQSLLASRPAR
jgi:hypothetical protein